MKTSIIAEIGINHNGSVELGKKIIDSAFNSGVNAVKFQTYIPDLRFNKGSAFIDIFKKYHLNIDEEVRLWEYAKNLGLHVLTTPFDLVSVDNCKNEFLDGLKIASFETTNKKLVRGVASLGLPTYFSTGQNSIEEVDSVISILKEHGVDKIIPMHCISSYPMKENDANLNVIKKLQDHTNMNIGFSDHSEGHKVAGYAVAMGAICIEKHFTIDNNLEGPDHSFSMNPKSMAKLVNHIKEVETILGSEWMGVREGEKFINTVARRVSD